jgi:hypothetical protein
MKQDKRKQKMKPHWYKMFYSECFLCGIEDNHRERVYGEKPKDPHKRYFYSQFDCGCHW